MSEQHDIFKLVDGDDSRDEINQAIKLPTELHSVDGRIFKISEWNPSVKVGQLTTVSLVVDVSIPIGGLTNGQ